MHITGFFYSILLGFAALIFYSTTIKYNIVESVLCTLGVSTEHEDNSRVKLIVEINFGLLLGLDRSLSD